MTKYLNVWDVVLYKSLAAGLKVFFVLSQISNSLTSKSGTVLLNYLSLIVQLVFIKRTLQKRRHEIVINGRKVSHYRWCSVPVCGSFVKRIMTVHKHTKCKVFSTTAILYNLTIYLRKKESLY